MLDIKKISFIIGMVLIIGPRLIERFSTPLPKSIRIVSSLIGLGIVIAGSIISDSKKKQSK